MTTGRLVAAAVRSDPAEARRTRLLTGAVAGAGAFLIGAAAIAAVRGDSDGYTGYAGADGELVPRPGIGDLAGLAPYVSQAGLRPGVVLGAVLLVVPFAALAVQVVRLGSAARERRLSAIRLAGATAADLRRIAAAEGARPGLRGALLAGPAYLLLWLLLGVLTPAGSRLLPPPGPVVPVAWAVLVPVLTGTLALAAMRAVRAARVDPLGGSRRVVRPLTRAGLVLPALLGGAVLAVVGWILLPRDDSVPRWVFWLLPGLLVAAAVCAGPALVTLAGRLHARRGRVDSVLAGRRLLADPRTPGRVAGVLLAVGLATGIAVGGIGTLLDQFVVEGGSYGGDLMFYLGGYLAALAGIGFALVVAALSLTVGAAEQLLDARRPTAVLIALGMTPAEVTVLLRRQLAAAAVAPALVGSAVGWLLWWALTAQGGGALAFTFGALPAALLLAGVAASLGARLVARLLRAPLAEACSVESLRAA